MMFTEGMTCAERMAGLLTLVRHGNEDSREFALETIMKIAATVDAKTDPNDQPISEGDPDYLSRGMPDGFDTILGYLAKYDPEAVALGGLDEPDGTMRDGFKLTHWCEQDGVSPVKVLAPTVLTEHGIHSINAYPIYLLKRRFPT